MKPVFKAGGYVFDSSHTLVMGILNVTPDSFSDGGEYFSPDAALKKAYSIQAQGADILDIGGQSTRPGAVTVSDEEEFSRLLPVITALESQLSIPVSVDTFYPTVAAMSIKFGASIINDVHGFTDEKMLDLAAGTNVGCVVVHSGDITESTDTIGDIKRFFEERLLTFEKWGISRERICLDAGIGFGKTHEQNLHIIRHFSELCSYGVLMMAAASRKRVVGIPCGNPPLEDRLGGTIAIHTIAAVGGAGIIRVHDVKDAVQSMKVKDAVFNG